MISADKNRPGAYPRWILAVQNTYFDKSHRKLLDTWTTSAILVADKVIGRDD